MQNTCYMQSLHQTADNQMVFFAPKYSNTVLHNIAYERSSVLPAQERTCHNNQHDVFFKKCKENGVVGTEGKGH